MVHDVRTLLRRATERKAQPAAAILDSCTLQSSPDIGHRAGYDGAKRKRGSKVHRAVDTLGHLLAWHVPPANEQDRTQMAQWTAQVLDVTGEAVARAFVDQGHTGAKSAQDAAAQGILLEVVKLSEAKKGYVWLPKRWLVERGHLYYPYTDKRLFSYYCLYRIVAARYRRGTVLASSRQRERGCRSPCSPPHP
jgi:hypothetical protein